MTNDDLSLAEFLESLDIEEAEQDAFEQELLQGEIEVTAHSHAGGTAPIAEDPNAANSPDQKVSSGKFCTKCGNEIKLGKAFCSKCGAPVKP